MTKLDQFLDQSMEDEVKKHADPDRAVTRKEVVMLMMQQKDLLRDSGSYNVRLVQDAYAKFKRQQLLKKAEEKKGEDAGEHFGDDGEEVEAPAADIAMG